MCCNKNFKLNLTAAGRQSIRVLTVKKQKQPVRIHHNYMFLLRCAEVWLFLYISPIVLSKPAK